MFACGVQTSSCLNVPECVCTSVLILHVSIDKHVFSGSAGAGRAGTNGTSNHSDRHQGATARQTHSVHFTAPCHATNTAAYKSDPEPVSCKKKETYITI